MQFVIWEKVFETAPPFQNARQVTRSKGLSFKKLAIALPAHYTSRFTSKSWEHPFSQGPTLMNMQDIGKISFREPVFMPCPLQNNEKHLLPRIPFPAF